MKRFKHWWRNRVGKWWADYHWPILLIIGLVAIVMGFIGFTKNEVATGQERSILDNIYLTLGLLYMNSGIVSGPVSWELQLARFIVPAIAAYTALSALAMVFTQQAQQVRLWSMRDHIIICGLGRKGERLANQFLEGGDKIVVIESDENNPWIESSRAIGAVVLIGSASDLTMLRKVRLNRANSIISVTGDDGKNAEVAILVEKLSSKRKLGTLICMIHIVDPGLWYLLREKELTINMDSHLRLAMFNIYDRGAGLMLKAHSPWLDSKDKSAPIRHLIIIGLGKMGERLLIQAALQWREQRNHYDQCMRFTIIDRYADEKKKTLCVRYPDLEDVVELNPLQIDVRSADFQRARFLYDEGGICDVDAIYICFDDDSLGLYTALTLHQKIRGHQVPIIVRMAEEAGLALLLREDEENKTTYKNLHAFPLLEETCTPDLIMGGTHEVLARMLHDAYLEGLEEKGKANVEDPASAKWDALPEDIKEKNRQQADRISVILEEHGYRIAPLTNWKTVDLAIREGEQVDQVESMARMEHELWCKEMIAKNWRYGPNKDEKLKTNPDLCPWDDLPQDEQDKNNKFIRALPRLLAHTGFQIEREETSIPVKSIEHP